MSQGTENKGWSSSYHQMAAGAETRRRTTGEHPDVDTFLQLEEFAQKIWYGVRVGAGYAGLVMATTAALKDRTARKAVIFKGAALALLNAEPMVRFTADAVNGMRETNRELMVNGPTNRF